jgi:hypothetical protein
MKTVVIYLSMNWFVKMFLMIFSDHYRMSYYKSTALKNKLTYKEGKSNAESNKEIRRMNDTRTAT